MKILFVAMSESVHTSKWINLLSDENWALHLFPSRNYSRSMHQGLKNVVTPHLHLNKEVSKKRVEFPGSDLISEVFKTSQNYFNAFIEEKIHKVENDEFQKQVWHLCKTIEEIQPDIIHSMESQDAGYLLMAARLMYKGKFPRVIHSLWGNDLYLFGRLKNHREKIHALMQSTSYLLSEGKRDEKLADEFGFKGKVIFRGPVSGGLDFDVLNKINTTMTSKRKAIIIKGYQGWSGRALTALRSIELCRDKLIGYRIIIFSATPEIEIAAELISQNTGLQFEIVPLASSHEMIMTMFAESKIYIGLNISDGLPNSLLEATAMKCYPIQSNTSMSAEYFNNKLSISFVHPEEVEQVKNAILDVIDDDEKINNATEVNYDICFKNFDRKKLKKEIILMYRNLMEVTNS